MTKSGPRSMALGTGREFDRIRTLLGRPRATWPDHVRVGAGDDAAVLAVGSLVVSTDLSIEEVHFRRDWLDPEEIGYRAVSAALSDLAAMAAEPVGVLSSVAVPRDEADATLEALGVGMRDGCDRAGAPLLGGDLSASPGPIVLDIVVLGQAERPLLRSGALAGDELWVTGSLGGSAAAVRAWHEGGTPGPALREAFTRPSPRLGEARWLAEELGPHAMIDLSDGLLGDAGHIAAASDVAVRIDRTAVPVAPAVLSDYEAEASIDLALSGGEDFELCFAVGPGLVDAVSDAFQLRFDLTLTRVGSVQPGSGVWVASGPDGEARRAGGGFDHFSAEPGS